MISLHWRQSSLAFPRDLDTALLKVWRGLLYQISGQSFTVLSFFEGDDGVNHLHYMHKKRLKGIQYFRKKKINCRIRFSKTVLSLNLELSL